MQKVALAALAAIGLAGSAQAVDFNFYFTDDPAVHGTIFGLIDNASSTPVSIFATNGTLSETFTAATTYRGSFTVNLGVITAVSDYVNYVDGNNGVLFNAEGSAQNLVDIGVGAIGSNQLGFAGVIYTNAALTSRAPEPATWAMMLAGFGAIGTAMRRRQRVAVSFG